MLPVSRNTFNLMLLINYVIAHTSRLIEDLCLCKEETNI